MEMEGIKKTFLDELDTIYKMKSLKDEVCSRDIIDTMVRVSTAVEREVSVAIDRRGTVTSVAIGRFYIC